MSNVANCYYLGRGVEQDYNKAAEFHTKAANLGYANSQEVLGEMYMEGKGVEQNYTQAAYWLNKSCENGERSAFAPFGDCHRKGLGVEMDEKKAFELYQKGSEMGDLRSKVSMAECLIEGWGTKCDDKQAAQILEAVCNAEEEYRENLVTMITHEDESGRIFIEDPLDEVIIDTETVEDVAIEEDADDVIIIEEEELTFEAAERIADGWQKEGNYWCYYKDGEKVHGWQKIGGKYYYFSDYTGYMYTGLNNIESKYYFFSNSGEMLKGWIKYNNGWYYFENSGAAATGWKQIGGKWYYFYDSEYSYPRAFVNGTYDIGNSVYYFNNNGVLQTNGWIERKYSYYSGYEYSYWYYADKNGKLATGWKKIGSSWYYFYSEGQMATGATQIEGSWYFFDYNNGAMYTKSGWVKYTDTYYINGEEFTSSSTTNYYCTGSSGKLVTGWKKIGNYWFYFGDGEYQPSCAINTIYTLDDGSMFIFDSNGHLKTGWIEYNGISLTR